MEELTKRILDRLELASISAIDKTEIVICILVIIAFFATYEVIKTKTGGQFELEKLVVRILAAIIISYLCLALFGPGTVILDALIGLGVTFFLYAKFFNIQQPFVVNPDPINNPVKIRKTTVTEITKKYIQDRLNKHPNPTILDILEWYGYISINQKGKIFSNNIWETPEKMAEMFIDLPALTEREYKEAIAIMNVLHMDDFKIGLSKQEALEIVTRIIASEEVIHLEEIKKEGTEDEKNI
jgi:hypothetical protein